MSRSTDALEERTREYVRAFALQRESERLARLREETSHLEMAQMQISVEQGRFMALLIQMLGAKRIIEVGVFTGYSSLCMAEHLPADGTLVACDTSKEWTSVARRYWDEAGVADRVDLRLGPASDTLAALVDEGGSGTWDFAFIDADKKSYDDYYEKCLALLRPGGVVAIDNIFMHGSAIDPAPDAEGSKAIHAVTQKAATDDRVDPSLVPIGDGVLLARKR